MDGSDNEETEDGLIDKEIPTSTQTANIPEETVLPLLPKLKVGTLNIQDGRRNQLNAALRCMSALKVDFDLIMEIKFAMISVKNFTKSAEGNTVIGTQTNGSQGGVALIYRDGQDSWVLERTGLLREKELSHNQFTKSCKGYLIVATKGDPRKGGLALVYWTWGLESTHTFGWNEIRMILVAGQQQ